MKDELQGWDPFPLQPKGEGESIWWDEVHLESREHFKEIIRPPAIPESAREIGPKLQQARKAKGISIAQVAAGTFIQPRYLQAIEEGQIEKLPGGLYTRRFIESYAQFLNFDLRAVSLALAQSTATTEVLKGSIAGVRDYNKGKVSSRGANTTKLPRFGELLLYYFLPEEERDAFIGDVEETYAEIVAKFGTRAAEVYFWKEIVNSMSPLMVRFIARIILAMLDEMTKGH